MPWPRRNTGSRLRYGSETTGPAVSTASASSNKASGRRHRHLRISRRNPARSASAFPPAGWHDCSCHPILNATAAAFSGRSFPDLREGGGRTRCSRLPRQHRSKHRDRPLHHGTDANTRYSTPCVTLVKTQVTGGHEIHAPPHLGADGQPDCAGLYGLRRPGPPRPMRGPSTRTRPAISISELGRSSPRCVISPRMAQRTLPPFGAAADSSSTTVQTVHIRAFCVTAIVGPPVLGTAPQDADGTLCGLRGDLAPTRQPRQIAAQRSCTEF